ncbi:DUF2382 domain-containing protein [Luteococcus peritonei]|uniref:DUF2382 domain-containing protein n=1 Tax=Luteococcus peritonei TaxID=88874 RepID=A0ABW4RUS9_9ACTN
MTEDRNLDQPIGERLETVTEREAYRQTDERTGLRADDYPDRGDHELTLHAEQLTAEVESHEWSRVRVTRCIVHGEKTITVPVRREELVVEYLGDEQAPKGHPGTVRGSTDTVDSRVVVDYVLHEEVPHVEVVAVPRERVQVIVDTQQSMVRISDQIRREEVVVEGADSGVLDRERVLDERN